jgi:hypothetical protein
MIAAQYLQAVRLQLSLTGSSPYDANTGTAPQIYRASNVAFQCAIFDAYNNPVNVANLSQMQLVLQPSPTSLYQSVSITVPSSGFNANYCDWSDWQAGLLENVTFDISAAMSDLSLNGQASAQYWLIVQGTTITNQIITYTAGYITVLNTSWALPPNSSSYVSRHAQNSSNTVPISVVPASQLHTEKIILSGSGSPRTVIVSSAGLFAGAHVWLRFSNSFQTTIVLNIYDMNFPTVILVTAQTDQFTTSVLIDLVFNGSAFEINDTIIPAAGLYS